MASTTNFNLTYSKPKITTGGALSNATPLTSSGGGGGGSGTVTLVNTGTGLTGGPITVSGTVAIANTSVPAGSYGDGTHVGTFTVNSQGQLTAASNVAITYPSAPVTSVSGSGSGISVTPTTGSVVVSNTGVTSLAAGTGIAVSGSTGSVTVSSTITGVPSGTQGQVLLEGPSSTPTFYTQAYNVNAFSSLSAAITAAGSTGVLYFPTAYTISNPVQINIPVIIEGLITLPSIATVNVTSLTAGYIYTIFSLGTTTNAQWNSIGVSGTPYVGQVFTATGSTTGTGTVTVQNILNGTIQASLKQIFSGGTVSIGPNTPYIYPEWFGTYKNNSGDDSVAINLALNAVYIDTAIGGSGASTNAVFLSGTYYISNSIYLCYNVSGSECGSIFRIAGGAQINALSGYTGDGIIYKYNSANTISDVPSLSGFNGSSAAALTILGCSVLQLNCFAIYNSNIAVKVQTLSSVGVPTGGVLDNIVRVQFMTTCKYGYYYTGDNSNIAFQGNEFYTNFYTCPQNGNGFTAFYSDDVPNGSWNGNTVQFKAIDLNGCTNSYGFYNANTLRSTWVSGTSYTVGTIVSDDGNNYYCTTAITSSTTEPQYDTTHWLNWGGSVINCIFTCDQWFGGINSNNVSSAIFVKGYYIGCQFRLYMQGNLGALQWNNFSMYGSNNRIVYTPAGGDYNIDPLAGQPYSGITVYTTSGRSTTPEFNNRLTCKYNITSSIAAGGLLTLYVYIPITDAFKYTGFVGSAPAGSPTIVTSASNNFYCLPYPNGSTPIGLVFESAVDNSANVANEVILYFRNVSGGVINSGSGFFNFIFSCGL